MSSSPRAPGGGWGLRWTIQSSSYPELLLLSDYRLVGGDSMHKTESTGWRWKAGVIGKSWSCAFWPLSKHPTHLRTVRLENRQGLQLGSAYQIGMLPNRGLVAEKRVMQLGLTRPGFKCQVMDTSCHLLSTYMCCKLLASHFTHWQSCKVSSLRKLGLREVRWFIQGHTTYKGQNKDLGPGLLTPSSGFPTTHLNGRLLWDQRPKTA